MLTAVDRIPEGGTYDVVVVGAGAAGLSAALFAAIEGQQVLLVEHTGYLGGTTALSAGALWIPNTHLARDAGITDSKETAARYLTGVIGNHSSPAMRDAFLHSGPQAVAVLERSSQVRLRLFDTHPDYEQQVEGATMRGRSLEPVPFDGRLLGPALAAVRPPIPEFTILGGMMVDRIDIGHLLGMRRSLASFGHSARIVAAYARDRMAGSRRGTRLVMGNALVGRLVKSLIDRGVPMLTGTRVTSFVAGDAGPGGLVLEADGVRRTVLARRAIVLAAGGFGRHPTRRHELMGPGMEHSPAGPGHTGEMQDLALGIGARLGEGNLEPAFWTPVSVRRRADGSSAVFPHFVLDRAKPGTVCVNQQGERFVNEAASYHQFGRAMRDTHEKAPAIPCFIITDAVGLRAYGLGMIRMGTRNLRPYLADGYLTAADTLAELARKLAVPPDNLQRTIAAMNGFAVTGVDPQFGRGTTGYHRHHGDAAHPGPNPTLGPIATPPFYAVRLYAGDIGGATGLAIDPWARVLGPGDVPISRLYACGNEAQSVMGGTYPGPGITLGPAVTFAYRAIMHAVHGERGAS